jgi:hypothetical protein
MELRPIERTTRARGRLDAALGIYRDTILPEAQNPERQILYWIDHAKTDLGDEFRCFAIQRGDQVVGYLQLSYFREEHIFFFEYFCIRDSHHNDLGAHEAVKSIEDYLAQNYRPGFTIVFEIAQKRKDGDQWKSDTKLVTYFKRLGFRVVDFEYRYPILQSYDGEASYPAELMVRLPDSRASMTASEMRTVLRCIYFKHYLRWDRPFLEPARFGERERLINELYSRLICQIDGRDTFGTSGFDGRSRRERFLNKQASIKALLDRIFGPKLPRLAVIMVLLLITQRFLGSVWILLPFVLICCAVYCLAEDTDTSRKLFLAILSRLRNVSPR